MMRRNYAKSLGLFIATLALNSTTLAFAPVESRSGDNGAPSARGALQNVNPNVAQVQKVEYLQQEVQELRGKVEELTYQLQQLQEQQKKLYLDLEKRLGEKSTSTNTTAASSPSDAGISFDDLESGAQAAPNSAASKAQSTSAGAVNQSEEQAYRQGYKLIQKRDFKQALVAFQNLVKDYPQGKYLPNAYYWMGEIYLNKGELDAAKESFSVVYQKYPTHNKAADALLKLGYVEQAKGRVKEAKELLNKVKTQYPGTTPAQLAESRLQRLRQESKTRV